MSKATMFIAMNNDAEIIKGEVQNAPWIEIKEMMLQYFLPDEYAKLFDVKKKLEAL